MISDHERVNGIPIFIIGCVWILIVHIYKMVATCFPMISTMMTVLANTSNINQLAKMHGTEGRRHIFLSLHIVIIDANMKKKRDITFPVRSYNQGVNHPFWDTCICHNIKGFPPEIMSMTD